MAIKDRATQEDCGVYLTNAQLGKNKSITGKNLDPNASAIPCGYWAVTYFKDRITIPGYTIK
jgi:hypothetical protein